MPAGIDKRIDIRYGDASTARLELNAIGARSQLHRIGTRAGCDAISEMRELRNVSHDCSVFRERVSHEPLFDLTRGRRLRNRVGIGGY
jgi:hypothetical protein